MNGRLLPLFIGAVLVSKLGNQLLFLSVPLAIYDTTGSAALALLSFAATALPWVASPFLGVIVDRFDRRKVFAATEAVQGIGIALLGTVLLSRVNPATFLVLTLVGCAAVMSNIIVGFVFIPALAPPERLSQLNGFFNASSQVVALVGLPIGGLVYAGLGARLSLNLDAATFLFTIVISLILPAAMVPRGQPRKIIAGAREGWQYLRRERPLMRLAWILGICNVGAGSLGVVVLQLARGGWQWSPIGAGFAMGVGAAGTAMGAVIGARFSKHSSSDPTGLFTLWLAMLAAGAFGILLFAHSPWLLIGFLVLSVGEGAVNVQSLLLRQLWIPSRLTGRVNLIIRMIILGAVPLSGVLQGALDSFDVRWRLSAPVICAGVALVAWSRTRVSWVPAAAPENVQAAAVTLDAGVPAVPSTQEPAPAGSEVQANPTPATNSSSLASHSSSESAAKT